MSPHHHEHPFRTRARTADIDAVERIVRATGVFSEAEIGIARELVEENLAKGEDASGYRFLFADDAQELRGYTCFGPVAGTDRRYELYWIAVSPEGRRMKLGQRLLAATEEAVRTLGGVYLFAETSTLPGYEPARKFYRAQGYALKGAISDWHADGDGLEIYGKRLVSTAP